MHLISEERPLHREAIRQVVAAAFGRSEEAELVDALRASGDLVLALVAERAGQVCGCVAISRMAAPAGAIGLAPLAVLPSHQRLGIGTALVAESIERTRALGSAIIFVVGAPAYYARFGFSAEAAAGFSSRFAGPHFMALRLADDAAHSGRVAYPKAIEEWREPD